MTSRGNPEFSITSADPLRVYFEGLTDSKAVTKWLGGLLVREVSLALEAKLTLAPEGYAIIAGQLVANCTVPGEHHLDDVHFAAAVGQYPEVYKVETIIAARQAYSNDFAAAAYEAMLREFPAGAQGPDWG